MFFHRWAGKKMTNGDLSIHQHFFSSEWPRNSGKKRTTNTAYMS